MKSKKNTSGNIADRALAKDHEEAHSPQKELLDKSRHNPDLGRKPAGKDQKPKTPPANEKLGSTTERVKKKTPKHKTLDTSGQDRDL